MIKSNDKYLWGKFIYEKFLQESLLNQISEFTRNFDFIVISSIALFTVSSEEFLEETQV